MAHLEDTEIAFGKRTNHVATLAGQTISKLQLLLVGLRNGSKNLNLMWNLETNTEKLFVVLVKMHGIHELRSTMHMPEKAITNGRNNIQFRSRIQILCTYSDKWLIWDKNEQEIPQICNPRERKTILELLQECEHHCLDKQIMQTCACYRPEGSPYYSEAQKNKYSLCTSETGTSRKLSFAARTKLKFGKTYRKH